MLKSIKLWVHSLKYKLGTSDPTEKVKILAAEIETNTETKH